jgi:zinc transport system substrate-binding protein
MFMKKTIKLIILLLLVAVLAWWLFDKDKESKDREVIEENGKIKIVATLFPLYDLSQAIGGDRVASTLLLPPGLSPHAFEPTPSDMLKINQADLFIYTGEYLEPWADKLLKSLNKSPNFLVLGQDLNTLELSDEHSHDEEDEHEEDEHEEDEHEEDEHEEDEHSLDPHIWLDPILMIEMANRFTDKLIALDPAGEAFYLNNLEGYKVELEVLDADFRDALADCRHREIIYGGHYAFGYLANRYNLEYEAAQGFSPDAESTPSRLADLVGMLKEHESSYLFAANMENPQLADTLAREAGAEILILHTVHNLSKDERDEQLSYQDLMRFNLNNLKQGLECR